MPFLLGLLILASAARAEIAVIVNAQNPLNSLTRSQVTEFFLKKAKQWPSGTSVRFFDQSDDSQIRKEFLRTVLLKSSRDIELYWIGQKLYSGHSAPTQLSSDAMMEIMVSRFPGAIGYISNDYVPSRPVKKINITEE